MAILPKDKERELLRKLAPLNTLSNKELEQILQETSVDYLNRGEYLFREGDTDPENIYILSGTVAFLKGKAEVETLMGDTDTARFAIAHQFPRQHTVRAKSRVEYIRINSHRLSELVENAHANAYRAENQEQSEIEDWKNLLLQSRVFQLIPRANIQHVLNRMEEVLVHAGEEIIVQGEVGDYFYLISEGRCSVAQKSLGNHQSIEVAKLVPGDCFGEDALLSDNLRSGTVTMLTDGLLMRLNKDDFISLIKHPLATTISFTDACKRIAANSVWLDIRSPQEYELGHMKSSINLPLNSLRFQASSLAPDHQYIIYCQDGRYSTIAAFLLLERGFDVVILSGGITAVPKKPLTCREVITPEQSAQIIALRPDEHAIITQHKQPTTPQSNLKTHAQVLEDQLLELRKENEQKQHKLMAQVRLLEQRAKRAEGSNADLDREISSLKSKKLEQKAELDILLSTAQEHDQIELTQLRIMRKKFKRLQQKLIATEKEKEEALQQLETPSKQNKTADVSSLICTPDVLEMDRVVQLQASMDNGHPQTTEQLQEKEKALQTVLDNLEHKTGSTMDAVDQEAIRQEVAQLRISIKERSYELERAMLEQCSLEDALEDRDAQLEQINQEMEQLKVQLESVTTRYNKAEEINARLTKQSQLHRSHKEANRETDSHAVKSGSRIKMGIIGMLVGGLLCFSIINVLLVLNGKDELIFSLTGETATQEFLSGWLVSEEINVKAPKPLDRKRARL